MAAKSRTDKVPLHSEVAPDTDPRICFPPLTHRLEAIRRSSGPRHISPADGRALEILGHAIEYLADEYALKAAELGILSPDDPRIDAMHILMALNREVYYSCPEVEPALARMKRWLLGSHVSRSAKRRVN